MSQLSTSKFFEPKPYPELNGEPGLTSEEIAISLGAQHQHVAHRIRKISERLQISVASRMEMTGDKGRPKLVYILPVFLAKMVVARYENEVGFAYLRFLLECERVATELVPKLLAQIKELEARLQIAAPAKKPKALPKQKTVLKTTEFVIHDGLFGEQVIERIFKRTVQSSLTEAEILEAKMVALILQNEGIAAAINRIKLRIDFLNAPKLQLIKGEKDA